MYTKKEEEDTQGEWIYVYIENDRDNEKEVAWKEDRGMK